MFLNKVSIKGLEHIGFIYKLNNIYAKTLGFAHFIFINVIF
ncbi:hypothetical protein PCARR_a0441 [Pseudoalteromonas carrageenovora IAM 12662]|uniref:Transposase n=1 Tax=Pseudoalteromonas carrageenovora IAM 12662 TaxID=1314868 RepID=A0ABR9ENP5_PSEVC|nr:hypothetical protein [Pseudoalteromonas carrageenovora IAM 12662]